MFALLSLMTGRQTFVVDKISNMLIRESSDLDSDTTSDEEQYNQYLHDTQQYARTIFSSNDQIDKRLIEYYRQACMRKRLVRQ